MGGTQSLHTNSYDEAIALPTQKAARLAVRTQQVLAFETDLTQTVDPFAGSYVMESLTDDLEAEIRRLMDAVAERGGAVTAIEEGFQKNEIEQSAYAVAQEIDSGERVVVGLNRYALAEEEPYEPLRVDPAIEADQAARLARLRAERDGPGVLSRPGGRTRDGARDRQRPAAAEGGAPAARDGRRGVRRAAGRLGDLPADGAVLSGGG